jgi:hypothetical protein
MKKVIFGLLLIAGVLFVINYLGGITSDATSKVGSKATSQLIATDNKDTQNQPTTNEKKPEATAVAEQVGDAVKQVTDSALAPLNKSKPQIATIKIHDKKTGKDIDIETQTMREAQKQPVTPQQQDKEDRFESFYHKSEKCISPADNETRVACGNEYIRAKTRFEELYKQGKI